MRPKEKSLAEQPVRDFYPIFERDLFRRIETLKKLKFLRLKKVEAELIKKIQKAKEKLENAKVSKESKFRNNLLKSQILMIIKIQVNLFKGLSSGQVRKGKIKRIRKG